MPKNNLTYGFKMLLILIGLSGLMVLPVTAHAAQTPPPAEAADQITSLWELIVSGGSCMIFLGMVSVAALALIIYHFIYVTPEKLTPRDFCETLIDLLDKKQIDKAVSLCKQQQNLISEIALKGFSKIGRGKAVVEEAVQVEGKIRVEKLWEKLGYLGDTAVIAPMLGLLGTILGMIQAFNYQAFKAGIIKPVILAQGLAKAMITTAYGLIIAVPVLVFYSYFRSRIVRIQQDAERVSSEMLQLINKT